MNPQSIDNLAIGLALGAILMRLLERPWWASVFGSVSLLASTVAGSLARRRVKPWS